MAKARAGELLRSEDWVSVWLGAVLIILVLVGVRPEAAGLSCSDGLDGLFGAGSLATTFGVGAALGVLCLIGVRLMEGAVRGFAVAFGAVFVLAWAARAIACNSTLSERGVSYAITALALGLFVSNVLGVPGWLRGAIRTEYYIKTGLVILGTNVLFGQVLEAGMYGMVQAAGVIAVIWYLCFWLSRKLRVDEEFSAMMATAVSICGVSAAIAACGAISGDRKKLSYVTSLVLVVAAPMMILMPLAVDWLDLSDIVGGAWIGGTIDTTGAVVVAGESIGDSATNAATIVKLSQNALLGVAAFALSVWWTVRGGAGGADNTERPEVSAAVIWERFPKFVLGFLATSLLFSFVLTDGLVDATGSLLKGLRTWLFALAFVCIGLETRLRDLLSMEGGRPAAAFVIAQAANVLWTLLLAWVLFGGAIFGVPDL
ncbi:MAG: putative sulfate exporter family transporter [Acidimicrobiaceae bacterium]|nr:putative sulfate exporter family transporter [Acidimicrobiaceae bacterium]MDE0517851.1 putative sulfate exporter family transporter [Acidimicrobiaceae bacterium]MDE0656230.1 putative sulfate exporter family transporter [Acidimicrobiaceae bacterium]